MRFSIRTLMLLLVGGVSLLGIQDLSARPPMGGFSGGGARGGGGGGMARPMPQSRPMPQARPSMPSGGMSGMARPSMPSAKPNLPQSRPANLPGNLSGNLSGGGMVKPQTPQMPSSRPGLGPSKPPSVGGSGLGNAGNLGGLNRPTTRPTGPIGPTTRPSPGGSGGGFFGNNGGGLSSLPGNNTRPAPRPENNLPNINRPGQNRPDNSLPNVNRPNVNRPDNNRPNINRPDTNRPNIDPPINRPGISTKPADRPSLGGGNWPNRPGIGGDRPNIGGGGLNNGGGGINGGSNNNRPNIGNNNNNRPNIGNNNRPNIGDNNRPNIGNNNRPNIGENNRPNIGNNNRPNIGNNNRPNIGNNVNIGNSINNNINVNRPGGNWNNNNWGGNWNNNNWNNNNWGGNWNNNNWNNNWNNNNWNNNWNNNNWNNNWNNNHWGDNWYNNNINYHHHGWYHGCWHGGWGGGYYYAPLIYGATAWGMYGLASNWGYGATYYNPYYVAPTVVTTTSTPAYDYSQPIVVNNYVTSDSNAAGGTTSATSDSQATNQAADPAYAKFDEALAMFKSENYRQALSACDEAIAKSPKDPAMHEVRALIQFALGQYQPAAAGLNSLLASAPGMDWTTMSSLYGDIDSYTKQLRNLEQYCRSNTKDASALFVLAYHYLVAGHQDAAIDQLKAVVALQPKDVTAQRMLESLTENDQASQTDSKSAATTPDAPASNTSAATTENADANAPQTDLVGGWKAVDGKGTINLDVTEDFKFTWKASAEGQPAVELKGDIVIEGEMMILNNDKQGNLAGKVTSGGADKFTFVPAGAPSDFKGLVFERTASSK